MIPISPDEQKERLSMHESGMTDKQMGAKLFLTSGTIGDWRRKHNLPPNRRYTETNILALHSAGLTDKAISKKLHCSPMTVCKVRQKHNLPANGGTGWGGRRVKNAAS